jgi:hypothetical protein
MTFPSSKVLKVAASEINKDVADELQYKYKASPLQLAGVRRYSEFDWIATRAVSALGLDRPNQDAYVTNEQIDAFKAVIHEPMPDALYQAGIDATFVLDHSHCSRTEVWGRAVRIIRANGGQAYKRWDEVYN